MKKELAIAATAAVITSCTIEADAITTPFGIWYSEEGRANPKTIIHEECHKALADQMGTEFWLRYYTDDEWACNEERRCGIEPSDFPNIYPMCKK